MDRERLINKLKIYNISIDNQKYEALQAYVKLLEEWNGKFNLTALKEPEEVENKHIVDSLLLAVQPELKGKLLDVGSGAGLPGIICKIIKPDLKVTLMEPTKKRAGFLEVCNEQLELDCTVLTERAEEAARKGLRESYPVVTARAVASLPQLCEYCLPLVKLGGWFIAMKGEAEEELSQAQAAIEILGGARPETRRYELPDGSKRSIILVKKAKSTPQQYPRQGAKIKRSPLSTNVPRGTKKEQEFLSVES